MVCLWMHELLFLLHAAVTTLKMAGDAIANALWCLNIYAVIMARLLFDATDLESFWCSTMQSYRKLGTQSSIYCSALCKNIFVRVWIFLFTSFEKMYRNHFNASNYFSWLWVIVCQGLSDNFREAVTKTSLGLFLMFSKAWKCSMTELSCFVSRPTYHE